MNLDEDLLRDDEQARVDALDMSRSFIVQAPAGSGKTELLIQRYLKLLSVVDHPEEIVAITFTRKAAAEMQSRVLEALRRRESGVDLEYAHERLTNKLAGDALARSEAMQWNLMGNPGRMRILTLDALNASIARAKPLSSAAVGARVIVGAELRAIYESAAIATLDWLAEKGEMRAATQQVLRHVDNNTWLYSSYLAQMLATRDQWLPFIGSGNLSALESDRLREKLQASLKFAVGENLRRASQALNKNEYSPLFDLLDYASTNIRKDGGNGPIAELAGCTSMPDLSAEDVRRWQGISELVLTQKGEFRRKVDKRQGFPASDKDKKAAMHSILEGMSSDRDLASALRGLATLPPVVYNDDQWQVLLALFRLLPVAAIELRRLFDERGVSDYVDVALNASAALGSADNPGDVALLMDYQISHLLVDEMQDTSASQYQMLQTLTGGWQDGDKRTLFCVGDPMQSIYRFRNAEVGQFLIAKENGIGLVRLVPLILRQNFRSGENLVRWFNTVFPDVLARSDDSLRGAVSYSASVPVEHQLKKGACEIHAIFNPDREQEAAAGCQLIADILNSHPDDDMAVLVRGRTQLPELLIALRDAGIPYRAIEIDRLTDLPEIIEVLALARAAAHEGDRLAWLGLLRAPWIGLDWSDLHTLVRNDTKSSVCELLNDTARVELLSADGQRAIKVALPILNKLASTRRLQSLRDLVERTWFELGGPGILADKVAVENVYRFFEVLSNLERGGTLVDVAELESVLDLEKVSSIEPARLQIMTMHRAKGLQFDHVLLFGLGRQPGKGDKRVLSWFDFPTHDGIDRKIISPIGPRIDVDNDPIHRYIELTDADRDRQEQGRLLYVACTRAKKSLHLMGHTAVDNKGENLRPARSDSLLHLLWSHIENNFADQFGIYEGAIEESNGADDSPWWSPTLRRLSAEWQLPEPEGLSAGVEAIDPPGIEKEVEFYWVGSAARIAGTLIHRWLQMICNNSSDCDPGSEKFTATTVRWLSESGITEDAAQAVVGRVRKAMLSMLNDEKGQWILNGKGHAELALSGYDDGQIISVILDRVRIDDEGTHWIVDYKTSTHEGGGLDEFLQVETDRYRPQLVRYKNIYSNWANVEPRCALYFPLLKSFVEVSV